jgi:hypothetical protein
MPAGWTLSQTSQLDSSRQRISEFYKVANSSEPTTLSGTLSASRNWNMTVVEAHSTSAGGWVIDKTAASGPTFNSSPVTGTTGTTTQAEEYLVGVVGHDGASNLSLTSPTNSFAIKEQQVGSNSIGLCLLTRIVAATSTYSSGGTYSGSIRWLGHITTYKAQAATITAGGVSLVGTGRLTAHAHYATPTLSVTAAFGYTATDLVPVWTDISTYGATFGWQRGRQNELNQIQAGTASLVVHDPHSYFDPDNTASPFYPNVKPGLPIRAMLLVGDSEYPLFYGFAERLPRTDRVSSTYTRRQIDLVDGFALLANAGLAGDSYAVENSGTRVTNVLNNIGWPSTKRTIGTGSETLQDVVFSGDDSTSALSHLQELDASEDGLLYIDGTGSVVFVGRASLDTSSKATFSDVGITPATGIDSNTVLMLHADGADTSTTFTDSSQYTHTVTPHGNAQIDTAQSKFGGASALFDGTGDYLTSVDHADFQFGSGDFTIDFWWRPNSVAGGGIPMAKRPPGGFGEFTFLQSTTSLQLYVSSTGASWNIFNAANIATGLSTGTWYHIALVRTGNSLLGFLNGTQTVSTSTAASLFASSGDALSIGGDNDGSNSLNGWLDEVRISKGIARWTSNFTPPTAAYAAAGTDYPYINLVPSYDLDNVFNRWTVTRDQGSPQTSEDTTSQGKYFLRAKQTATLVSDDTAALAQAARKIAKFKDPLNRVEQMTIQPLVDLTNTAQIDAGLGRELGQVITIKETPPGFAGVQTKTYTIQQITGQVNAGPMTSLSLTFGVWPT